VRRAVRFANLLLTLGRVDGAREGYEAVLGASPGDAEALFNLGMCELRSGRRQLARDHWEKSIPRVGRAERALFREAIARLDQESR
jgi:tetratricopeptide (TPR) repeat protein